MSKKRFYQLGQGMTEYVIIVALVGVCAIGTYNAFGKVVRNHTAAMAAELAGQDGKDAMEAVKKGGEDALKAAKEDKNLSNYNGQTAAATSTSTSTSTQ